MAAQPRPLVQVAAGLISRRGRYLICKRPSGKHLAGYWEFPGGKRRASESWAACLRRELREEIGIGVRVIRPYWTVHYRYPDRGVLLKVFRCAIISGHPKPLDAQALRWVFPGQLSRFRFPPADRLLIKRLGERCEGPIGVV